jgi:hypothetical protein
VSAFQSDRITLVAARQQGADMLREGVPVGVGFTIKPVAFASGEADGEDHGVGVGVDRGVPVGAEAVCTVAHVPSVARIRATVKGSEGRTGGWGRDAHVVPVGAPTDRPPVWESDRILGSRIDQDGPPACFICYHLRSQTNRPRMRSGPVLGLGGSRRV